jgi:hypothetical protein
LSISNLSSFSFPEPKACDCAGGSATSATNLFVCEAKVCSNRRIDDIAHAGIELRFHLIGAMRQHTTSVKV